MWRGVRMALFLLMACMLPARAEIMSPFERLSITLPTANQDLSGLKQVKVSWNCSVRQPVTYSVAYSSDGKTFDGFIASGLIEHEVVWKPDDACGMLGWIKVKAYDLLGSKIAEDVVSVRFVPNTAVVISKKNQKLFYFSDGKLEFALTCSTGLPGYDLAAGRYEVYSRQRKHWSRKYEVMMPYSLFFHRGYAVHATTVIHRLGTPASHGCIRLHPKDARMLYEEVAIGTAVVVLPSNKDCSGLGKLAANNKSSVPKKVVVAKNT